jgi:TolA-binding protein
LKKGELLFNQKKYEEAAKVYNRFAEQNPDSKQLTQARYMLGKCYRAQGNLEEALVAFVSAANAGDVSEEIMGESLFEASEIYNSQHKPDKSIDILKHLQEKVKTPAVLAEAALRIGQSQQLLGNNKDARIQFEQVIKEYSDLQIADDARIALARLHFQAGEYDNAKNVAEKVANLHKDELGAEAQYIIGASYAGKKEWANVITALLRVKYLFPSYERWVGRAYLGLGDAYEETKDVRRARESYQAVLKLKTDEVVIEEAKQRLKKMEHK